MWRQHHGQIPELVWYAYVEPRIQTHPYNRPDTWIHPATKRTPDALLRIINGLLTTPELDIWTAEQLEIGASQPQRDAQALADRLQGQIDLIRSQPEPLTTRGAQRQADAMMTILQDLNQALDLPTSKSAPR